VSEVHVDAKGSKIGMWLFLFTELLLFGGMFLLYAVYRAKNATDFHFASLNLDVSVGAVNTVILLTSSLTMVLSIGMLERRNRKASLALLLATIAMGLVFLVNKYFEWSHKIHLHIYPNSQELLGRTPGENLFYALYYFMTGLHGLHVIAGMIVLAVMATLIWPETICAVTEQRRLIRLENAGLYWHLVDVIWIFLFPLFYLIS
jgi:cytochrome c oxidase subunit 3